MLLSYQQHSLWPPLAWVARIAKGGASVMVHHGERVELSEDWFCEATWDGPFKAGGFDKTEVVAGTGARVRGDTIRFVSSASTVERLHLLDRPGEIWVSNSLPGVLAVAGERLNPAWPYYHRDLFSVVRGLHRYVRQLAATGGPIELCYFDNLLCDPTGWSREKKPDIPCRFREFADVAGYYQRSIAGIASNMADGARNYSYEFMGSLSTGYDSTTITAIASRFGLQDVICFTREGGRDDGRSLAHYFDANPIGIDVDAWRDRERPEQLFIAADCFGEEAHYLPLEQRLRGRVFLSGFHGDKIWGRDNPYPNANLMRGDPSGGALAEFRLHVGFLHCPVPFLGARSARSLRDISRSDTMKQWDVGGDYTRPICRRIVEEAGVPRSVFGQKKSYASRWFASEPAPLSNDTHDALVQWIEQNSDAWLSAGRSVPVDDPHGDWFRRRLAIRAGNVLNNLPGARRFGLNKNSVTGPLMNMDMSMPYHPPPVFWSQSIRLSMGRRGYLGTLSRRWVSMWSFRLGGLGKYIGHQ